jgi:hypothetical protein
LNDPAFFIARAQKIREPDQLPEDSNLRALIAPNDLSRFRLLKETGSKAGPS